VVFFKKEQLAQRRKGAKKIRTKATEGTEYTEKKKNLFKLPGILPDRHFWKNR